MRIFNNIRKRLLAKGKTKKYLAYAIGEITLVIIGILIALQINNWNENRLNLQQGHLLLKEMKNEILSDINLINHKLEYYTKVRQYKKFAFESETLEQLSVEQIDWLLYEVNIDIVTKQNTFNKINNNGIVRLTDNKDFNHEVENYYNQAVFTFNRHVKWKEDKATKRDENLSYQQNEIILGVDTTVPWLKEYLSKRKENLIGYILRPNTINQIQICYHHLEETIVKVQKFKKKSIEILNKIQDQIILNEPNADPLPKEFQIK